MIINMNGAKAPEPPSPVYQEKTVTPETLPVTISADVGYDALGEVTVNPDPDLTEGNIRKGANIFGVSGTFAQKEELTLTVNIDKFPYYSKPAEGYVYRAVHIGAPGNLIAENIKAGVNIAGVEGSYNGDPVYPKVTVVPDHFPTNVTVPDGYVGVDGVTINKPTDLIPENIPLGKSICGVEGSYEQVIPDPVLETVTVIPESFPTIVNTSQGYDGMSKVTIMNPDNLDAGNIKAGVSIAGVTGTYDNTTPVEEKTTKATAFPVVVEPQSGYAMSKVTVTVPDNLTPENIASGVTIAGVTGTYEGGSSVNVQQLATNRIEIPYTSMSETTCRQWTECVVIPNSMLSGNVPIMCSSSYTLERTNSISNSSTVKFVSFDLGQALNTLLQGLTIPDGTYRPIVGLNSDNKTGKTVCPMQDTYYIKVVNGQFESKSVNAYSYGPYTIVYFTLFGLNKTK